MACIWKATPYYAHIGNIQTITVTVADDTGGKVAGANVQEEVLYVSGSIHTFPWHH